MNSERFHCRVGGRRVEVTPSQGSGRHQPLLIRPLDATGHFVDDWGQTAPQQAGARGQLRAQGAP